jgi:hypothetical protein
LRATGLKTTRTDNTPKQKPLLTHDDAQSKQINKSTKLTKISKNQPKICTRSMHKPTSSRYAKEVKEKQAYFDSLIRSQKRRKEPLSEAMKQSLGDSKKRKRERELEKEQATAVKALERQKKRIEAQLEKVVHQRQEKEGRIAEIEAKRLADGPPTRWSAEKLAALESGTLVWARFRNYPFWPGLVETNDPGADGTRLLQVTILCAVAHSLVAGAVSVGPLAHVVRTVVNSFKRARATCARGPHVQALRTAFPFQAPRQHHKAVDAPTWISKVNQKNRTCVVAQFGTFGVRVRHPPV